MNIVFKSIDLATYWHTEQWRKDAINDQLLPYITHPLEVMKTIWSWGASTPIIASAAVCHDLLEDTDCPPNEIAAIHPQVLSLVEELTLIVPKDATDKEKKALKLAYMESFKTASIDSLVIKAADRLCNVLDFHRTNPKYAVKYLAKAEAVFESILNRKEEFIKRHGEYCFTQIFNDYKLLGNESQSN